MEQIDSIDRSYANPSNIFANEVTIRAIVHQLVHTLSNMFVIWPEMSNARVDTAATSSSSSSCSSSTSSCAANDLVRPDGRLAGDTLRPSHIMLDHNGRIRWRQCVATTYTARGVMPDIPYYLVAAPTLPIFIIIICDTCVS